MPLCEAARLLLSANTADAESVGSSANRAGETMPMVPILTFASMLLAGIAGTPAVLTILIGTALLVSGNAIGKIEMFVRRLAASVRSNSAAGFLAFYIAVMLLFTAAAYAAGRALRSISDYSGLSASVGL